MHEAKEIEKKLERKHKHAYEYYRLQILVFLGMVAQQIGCMAKYMKRNADHYYVHQT